MTLTFDVELARCVVCRGSLGRFDETRIRGVLVRYDACTGCGLVQMNPRPTTAALDRHYEDEYRSGIGDEEGGRTGDAQERRARQQVEFVGRRPTRHLDVGCSMGTLLDAFGAPQRAGIEPGHQHREQAAARGIEVHETVEQLLATEPEPFDLITMSHVLEHLDDPVGFLPRLRPLLAPDGELFVEVPYLYRSIAYEIAHLSVFTKASLTSTLRAAGFVVTETTLHKARQGGLGIGRNIAVRCVAAEPVEPADRHLDVRRMRLLRRVGFAPQPLYRWRQRQVRRLRRNARRLVGRS